MLYTNVASVIPTSWSVQTLQARFLMLANITRNKALPPTQAAFLFIPITVSCRFELSNTILLALCGTLCKFLIDAGKARISCVSNWL